MSSGVNLLRKQVVSEVRKRRLILFTVIMLSIVYLLISLFMGDMGLFRYNELRNTKSQLETQIKTLSAENEHIRSEIKLLKEDPFFAEKHAREDFGLAKPDEYIFLYDR